MAFLNPTQVSGDIVPLATTNPRHLLPGGQQAGLESTKEGNFADLLMTALGGVNQLELAGDSLSQQAVVNPDSVDPADVTIALAKANLAVSLTKAVTDRVLRAYTDIINIR